MSGTQAHITEDIERIGVSVMMFNRSEGGTVVWAPGQGERHYVSPGVSAPNVEPLRLGDDEARALLVALHAHYGGVEDTRSLRRDYDHERKRVDQFIAHLTKEQ